MYLTDYLETKIQNACRNITYTAPAEVFLGLFATATTDAGGGVEIAYAGYTRQKITFSAPAPESGGLGIRNDIELKFPEAKVDSGSITHIGIFDSASGGNMLLHGALNEAKSVRIGVSPTLRVGEVAYWSTGNMSTAFKTAWLNTLRGQNLEGFTPHITLFNGNPESGGAELSGGNFQRKPIEFSAPAEQPSGSMLIENSTAVTLPSVIQSLGTYNFDTIYDRATGGIPVWFKESTPEVYGKGDSVIYEAGAIKIGVN